MMLGYFPIDQTTMDIFKTLFNGGRSVMMYFVSVIFSIRIVMNMISEKPSQEYLITVRDLIMSAILMYSFMYLVEGITHLPELYYNVLKEHALVNLDIESNLFDVSILEHTFVFLIKLCIAIFYRLSYAVYVSALAFVCAFGAYIIISGTLMQSYWVLKATLTFVLILAGWPLIWYTLNYFSQLLADQAPFSFTKYLILAVIGGVKLFIPLSLMYKSLFAVASPVLRVAALTKGIGGLKSSLTNGASFKPQMKSSFNTSSNQGVSRKRGKKTKHQASSYGQSSNQFTNDQGFNKKSNPNSTSKSKAPQSNEVLNSSKQNQKTHLNNQNTSRSVSQENDLKASLVSHQSSAQSQPHMLNKPKNSKPLSFLNTQEKALTSNSHQQLSFKQQSQVHSQIPSSNQNLSSISQNSLNQSSFNQSDKNRNEVTHVKSKIIHSNELVQNNSIQSLNNTNIQAKIIKKPAQLIKSNHHRTNDRNGVLS